MRPFGWICCFNWIAAAMLSAPFAFAAESLLVTSQHSTVSLISETDAVDPAKAFRVALRFRLAEGWHIYWSNPGDAGEPPELALTLPQGSTSGAITWPTPIHIAEGPIVTYSYVGEVVLPVTVTPGQFTGKFSITAKANWLICARLCVPEQGEFALDLTAGNPASSAEARLFAATDARDPRPSPFKATIAADGVLTLQGSGLGSDTVADAYLFPAAGNVIDQAKPQPLRFGENSLSLTLTPASASSLKNGLRGVVALTDKSGAVSGLTIDAHPGATPVSTKGPSLIEALVFAFLGGLILNLMPCVFPILAMKALGIVRLSGAERRHVRNHSLSYTAGIVATFCAIGVVLLVLRAGGNAVGWGFQFQSPVFVAITAWLLFAVGLNLSGVFEIGGQFAGAQNLAGRGGHVGSFFTGLLAVMVATPCTAPFMGAALASALTMPAAESILVLAVMGLGLAAPYVALGAMPGLARFLPRPGRWMEILKQFLAFPMYAAVVWLLWVITQQAGSDGVLLVASGLVGLGVAAWAYGLSQAVTGNGRRIAQAIAVLALIADAATLAPLSNIAAPALASAGSAGEAEPYNAARLAALRADGRPVFVNMTAAWCVTCLVNEKMALSPELVRKAFAEHHVAYMKGDWTRQDPAITAFLRDHQRDGVPLYVFYPAGDGAPTILPQILTESAILEQVDKAGG